MTHSITRAVPEPGPCDTAALACAIDLALYTGSCTPQPPSETEPRAYRYHITITRRPTATTLRGRPWYSKGFVTLPDHAD